ncbi:hypothetical protein KPL47_06935 [Clostridium estertheticum]|uniref:hypothetical protein n=1 Tax=Clostridium estertheticum TaxID=238834 RepID=UPI001C0C2F83|nr:hypothetical protein [Clostridium estertheticum]MBU3176102.1 hypothetical protein [Clostridium estertheticum]
MNALLIYDSTGYIISKMSGSVREPQGIPFIWVEIPEGKQIKTTDGIGVDVSVTPNVAILEDIPKTETELNTDRMKALEQSNAEMMNMIATMATPTV